MGDPIYDSPNQVSFDSGFAEVEEVEPEVEETEPDKSFDQVVQEVLEGKWGRGQERRLKLAQAGYDHVAVQRELVRIANGR